MVRRVGIVAALLSTVVAAGCGGGSSPAGARAPEPAATSTSPSAGPSTPANGRLPAYVVARVDLGRQPCAVEGGFGSVWVSVYGDDRLIRLDPRTHEVLARIRTGLSPCRPGWSIRPSRIG